jgi:hypothetical protein
MTASGSNVACASRGVLLLVTFLTKGHNVIFSSSNEKAKSSGK